MNTASMINDLIQGKQVTINNKQFEKRLMDELIVDLRGAYKIYKDQDCRNFIHDYYIYNKKVTKNNYDNIHSLVVALLLGFSGGIICSGIIMMIQHIGK